MGFSILEICRKKSGWTFIGRLWENRKVWNVNSAWNVLEHTVTSCSYAFNMLVEERLQVEAGTVYI